MGGARRHGHLACGSQQVERSHELDGRLLVCGYLWLIPGRGTVRHFHAKSCAENFGLALLTADIGFRQPQALTDCGCRRQDHNGVMKAEIITLFPICNISSMKLCVKRMDRARRAQNRE